MAVKALKHALLTGFKPFGTPLPADNRSWETIKQLQNECIETDSTTVVCHCHELPVNYGPVSEQVPKLHLAHPYSIVIHCGAGVSGVVRLEKQAHKSGYSLPGNGGPSDLPAGGHVPVAADLPETLVTEIDVDGLRDHLIKGGWDKTEVSLDPGRYLCDFTYYTSLAEARTTYEKRGLVPPKTLFVHVPPNTEDPYTDRELAELVRQIIRFLA
ncbi:hypothetical protein FBU59_000579 [Linderina macrospora]|uniref:Uncharacterized protein n=1 Tax=Linderina macrospora TaxID=4868 RepID=A0ACC1JGP4_9FUNG|nr:hypothetical protein FBU59_000579 [Linderina macrospora]